MIRGLFITGTDTGIGKTVVAAALMHRYRYELRLRYWKPIQTGIEAEDDTTVVRNLGQCSDAEILAEGVRLKRPVSPHLAAKLSGAKIKLEEVFETLRRNADKQVSWIIEGAGGPLVPINDSEQMVDLAKALRLPVLVVSRTKLGTINHTLLTLEALRRRALIVAGIVMVGESNIHNREAIEHYGAASVLGEMPFFQELNIERIKRWARAEFDPGSVLLDHLQLAHHALSHLKL